MRMRWIIAVVIVFVIISVASQSQNHLVTDATAQEPSPTYQVYLPIIHSPPWPPDVYLMSNHTHYVTYGYLHIVGEVFNHTSGVISFVEVYVDVFNSDGRLLDTDYTYTELDDVPPETKACFHLWLDEPPGWSNYDLYGTYYKGGDPLPNLTVYNDSGFLEYDGDYRVIGMVRNDHGTRVEYVSPVITLYDSSSHVIDCDFTYVNGTHLNPGESKSFENTFYSRDYSVVTSYQILVDGNPQ